jgi:hypothetical protein
MARAEAASKVLRARPSPFTDFYLDPWNGDDTSGEDGCEGFSVEGVYMFHSSWPADFRVGDDGTSTRLQEMVATAVLIGLATAGPESLAVWTDPRTTKEASGKGRSLSAPVDATLRATLYTCAIHTVHLGGGGASCSWWFH